MRGCDESDIGQTVRDSMRCSITFTALSSADEAETKVAARYSAAPILPIAMLKPLRSNSSISLSRSPRVAVCSSNQRVPDTSSAASSAASSAEPADTSARDRMKEKVEP
jgi:hypothetical protein